MPDFDDIDEHNGRSEDHETTSKPVSAADDITIQMSELGMGDSEWSGFQEVQARLSACGTPEAVTLSNAWQAMLEAEAARTATGSRFQKAYEKFDATIKQSEHSRTLPRHDLTQSLDSIHGALDRSVTAKAELASAYTQFKARHPGTEQVIEIAYARSGMLPTIDRA